MTLKEKIQFLHAHGYTQQKISDETGINQSSVSRILKDTQYVTGWIVQRIRQIVLSKDA